MLIVILFLVYNKFPENLLIINVLRTTSHVIYEIKSVLKFPAVPTLKNSFAASLETAPPRRVHPSTV